MLLKILPRPEQEDTLTVQIRAPKALPGLVPQLPDVFGAAATDEAAHSVPGQGLVEGTRRPAFLSQACYLLAVQPPARYLFPPLQKEVNARLPTPLNVGRSM